ncbi:MAG TPA: HAD family hydrolase [Burkholderiales bacterium]|nr:HAD family hydrolase [Burkholderiales bacterium]
MTLRILRPEVFARRPDAVLFDTDNTLYAYDPAHGAAMAAARSKAVRMFGIEPPKFDEVFAAARDAVKARLGGTASSHSRLLYFQELLEQIGLGSQVLLALDLEQTYWRSFLTNARLFPGVREFVDDLRIAAVPTAVVTDLTSQIQFRKIIHFGLDKHFDCVVTSEEVGCDKPDPRPFERAIAKMRPRGDCIWMIGDHSVNDIRGARESLRAVTLQKSHEGVHIGKGADAADLVFDDYAALRALFRERFD